MEIKNWIPLLVPRKEIIISHIGRFYPPNPECSKDMIVVMDMNGKIYNRKSRATDKEKIINGELFLIYIPSDNSNTLYDEEDAEISLDFMTELLSKKQNEKFIKTCDSESANTFVQKVEIFKRDFPDEYIEYEDRDAALQSIADFCNFNEIPSIYDNMLATAQKSKSIAEYLKASFSENLKER